MSQNLPSFASTSPNHAICLLHYRGYGGSSGKPAEAALHADALALFDKLSAQHTEISVIGRSLGSGVAIRLASQSPVVRLALVTPYDSIAAIAARQFPFFPVRWFLHDKFESWRHASAIRIATLLLAAEHDEVIPRASAERLSAALAPNVASLVVLPGVGHNNFFGNAHYWCALHSRPMMLDHKIPPPIVAGIIGLAMWQLGAFSLVVEMPTGLKALAAGILALVAIAFDLGGAISFWRARTTINPLKPEKSTTLVTSGVYRFTRNPMYVGMLLILLAWRSSWPRR